MGLLDPPARFAGLTDVTAPTVDGQIAVYDSATGKMKPGVRAFSTGLTGFGHSFLSLGCPSQQISVNRLAGMLGNVPVKNYGIAGSSLCLGDQTAGQPTGGFNSVLQLWQKIVSTNATLPHQSPQPSTVMFLTGTNDAGSMATMSSTDQATMGTVYRHVMRSVISFVSGAVYLDAATAFPDTAILTAFAGSGSWGAAVTETRFNSGIGYRKNSSAGATITHSRPAGTLSFGGPRMVTFLFLCPGTSSGVTIPGSQISFTLDGTTVYPVGFSASTPFDTSVAKPSMPGYGWQTPYIAAARIWVPTSGAHSIVATAGTGGMTLDSIVYEADAPPPIVWNNICSTPLNYANATFLANKAILNTAATDIITEYASPQIVLVDMDAALNYGDVQYWNTALDGTHPAEWGNLAIAVANYKALASMPVSLQTLANATAPPAPTMLTEVMALATSNVTPLQNSQTIDGVALKMNDRVLLTGQTTASQNGVWVCNTTGNWTRPLDFTSGSNAVGKMVAVRAGTTYANSIYHVAGTSTVIVDTDSQTWTQVGRTLGTGLTLTGNTLSVAYGATGTTAAAGNDSRLSDTRTPTDATVSAAKLDATQEARIAHRLVQSLAPSLTSPVGTTVVNTSSATTAITCAIPAAAAGDIFRFRAWGDHLNTVGSNQTFTLAFTLGGTASGSGSTAAQASSATRGQWNVDLIIECQATAAQHVVGNVTIVPTSSASGLSTAAVLALMKVLAVDLSAGANLVLNVTPSTANTLLEWRTEGYSLERIRA